MEKLIEKFYKEFCKLTNRSGGVLVHASIGEWHRFLAARLEALSSINLPVTFEYLPGQYVAGIEDFPHLIGEGNTQSEAIEELVGMFKYELKTNPTYIKEILNKKKENFVGITISDRFGNYYKID